MDKKWTAKPDLELLAACAHGEQSALNELHDRHASLCRGRAYDVLRDGQLADEAVQDAFLDLWKTAARFDSAKAQVRTWLCVLVHRRAVDLARREARHYTKHDDDQAVDPASYTAEDVLILEHDRRAVRSALARLGPLHREVLDLAYWAGLSQSEIAVHCGVPVGTIKSRTFDGLRQLATILGEPVPVD